MNKKELTPKQALTIVDTVITSNKLDLTASLSEDNQFLIITHTKENEEQANSLSYLFSGWNPKNKQEEIPKYKDCFYLVKNNILFTADVCLKLEKENLINVDALDSVLSEVLDNEPIEDKKGATADNLYSWIDLLTELKFSGQKHLHYIDEEGLKLLALELQKLYNTENAPLNKVLVSKFLEQFVAREVSEDYFIKQYVEAAYKRLYSQYGKLKEGFSGVLHKVTKTAYFDSLMLLSVVDSYQAQIKVIRLVESMAIPDVEESKPTSWKDYLVKLGVEEITVDDILIYAKDNDILEADPKQELSGLYIDVQNKVKEIQELAYKRSGIKGHKAEKKLNTYLANNFFGKETPTKLKNVLDAYSAVDAIGSYTDWLVMLCENFMTGLAEVGYENEQEAPVKQENKNTHTNFDGKEETEEQKFLLYLEYNMKLSKEETRIVLGEMFNVSSEHYFTISNEIAESTRKEIKTNKKRVVDGLKLQPSASSKGRKISSKMNAFLKETYLEENEITKSNCLKLFAKIKSEHSTMLKELENLYLKEVELYTEENSNAVTNMLNSEDIDFVTQRKEVTKVVRIAATDETQTPEQLKALEEKVLDSYRKDLTEKVYAKSKDVITEYKNLFLQA